MSVILADAEGTARVTHSERQNRLEAHYVVRSATRGTEKLGLNRKSLSIDPLNKRWHGPVTSMCVALPMELILRWVERRDSGV